jgi:hypothetical protein
MMAQAAMELKRDEFHIEMRARLSPSRGGVESQMVMPP